MQVSKKTINKWKKLREWTDVEVIAGITGMSYSSISRILSGKQDAKPETVLKIKEFYQKRKKEVSVAEDDNN